tara:strand:- start:6024 stop:6704 length:681 start_codon:yes stop_codon:yes gene_type:complete
MIDICVTHFGDKYSSKYITNLENAIGKNYSSDFNFIVKTDCPNGHWDKLSFFECDKPRIIMDIDIIVTSNIDDIIDHNMNADCVRAFPRWWTKGGCRINGGFYKVNPGPSVEMAMEKFYDDPEFWIKHYGKKLGTLGKGEQDFVEESIKNISYFPSKYLGIYTDGCIHNNKVISQENINNKYFRAHNLPLLEGDKFGPEVKLVHFIYDNNMIENRPQWIQDLWNTM